MVLSRERGHLLSPDGFPRKPTLSWTPAVRMLTRAALRIDISGERVWKQDCAKEELACRDITTKPPLAGPALRLEWPFRIFLVWANGNGLYPYHIHQSLDADSLSRKFAGKADNVCHQWWGNVPLGPEGQSGWQSRASMTSIWEEEKCGVWHYTQ